MANSGRNTTDMYYYTDAKSDYVGGTGTFYARLIQIPIFLLIRKCALSRRKSFSAKEIPIKALDAYQKA